ncbi:MAG: hypothetical protein P1U46_04050 [Patescibacteria group bacterium]|nr:hypothetical protein [Patescibacteria group bacterium]
MIIVSLFYFLITTNIQFPKDRFQTIQPISNDILPEIIYNPENYLKGEKSEEIKKQYIADLFMYNIEDYSKFFNIPFLVNYETIIQYDKSVHYYRLLK